MFSPILIFQLYVVALTSMKDTVSKRIYKCKCGTTLEEYVWSSEIREKEFECEKCGKSLGFNNIKVDKVVSIVSIRTPTKNR